MQRLNATFGWVLVPQTSMGPAASPPRLMLTDDAGATWRDGTPAGMGTGNSAIDFLDPDHAWVWQPFAADSALESSLWRTSDGGRHWTRAMLPFQAGIGAAISFVSPEVGYLLVTPDTGSDSRRTILYATADGWSSWTRVGIVPGDWQFWPPERPLVFLDQNDGFVADVQALQTHDGGKSWTAIDVPRPADVPAAAQSQVLNVVATGDTVLASVQFVWKTGATYTYWFGYEYVSRDVGRTWTLAWPGAKDQYPRSAAVAVDDSTWFRFPDYTATIPGDGYSKAFSVTHDGGATWTTITAALPPDTHFDLESFSSAVDGWAVISADAHCPAGWSCPYSGGLPGQLAETGDGGKTWQVAGHTGPVS
jgi:photosystem II stability/assembly factor-like uncharacterized protein